MRIAFATFEYPPDTAFGGIATYVRQAALLMSSRCHSVEIFAASPQRSGRFEDGNLILNLVKETNCQKFSNAVVNVFAERNNFRKFDVVESPECSPDGHKIRNAYPRLAHVAKLHTPCKLLDMIGRPRPKISSWLRHNYFQSCIILGALRRLRLPSGYQIHPQSWSGLSHFYEQEKNFVLNAESAVSPSQALADWASNEWKLHFSRTMVVPNPYIPSARLLSLPIGGCRKVVGFFGRLEERKGIADLIEAIPLILRAEPEARFRFVGKAIAYSGTGELYDIYLMRRLRRFRDSLQIVGCCSLDQMPDQYNAVDVCVFPSVWENFPNVCLEAMSAGRAIVATNAGGMAEMLEGGAHGVLIPPRDPKAIAEGVIRLLRAPDLRQTLGTSARRRVLSAYSLETIGPQLEQSYERAIAVSRQSN